MAQTTAPPPEPCSFSCHGIEWVCVYVCAGASVGQVRAGHGAGKPTTKIIAETADVYSFAAQVRGCFSIKGNHFLFSS